MSAREHDCAGAHRAGFLRDIKRRTGESPVSLRVESGGESEHFGVGRSVCKSLGLVVRPPEDAPLGVDDDAPSRHLAVFGGLLRLPERHFHVFNIVCIHR